MAVLAASAFEATALLETGLATLLAAPVAAALVVWLGLSVVGFSVAARVLFAFVLTVFIVLLVLVAAVVVPSSKRVANTLSAAWLVVEAGTPAISPLLLRKLGMSELLVSVVVPPTSTLTSASAGLAGVNN